MYFASNIVFSPKEILWSGAVVVIVMSFVFLLCGLLLDCIINDNHDYLLHILEGLAVPDRHAQIQDWDISGRVFLDYIHVIQTLQTIQQVLKKWHT